MKNDFLNPIKAFLFIFIVFILFSFSVPKKLLFWEQGGKKTPISSISEQYLNFAYQKSFFTKKEKEEIKESSADKEYQASINQIINPSQREEFVLEKIKPPYNVMIIGDSFIAGSLGIELEKGFLKNEVPVFRFFKSSTGLSRPDYFNWNDKVIELVSSYKPNIAIIMFGANDAQNIPIGDKGLAYGTKEWDYEYSKRVFSFLKLLKDNNIFVFWVGNPIAREYEYSDKMEHLNFIFEKESAKFLNCQYISTWDILSDGNGNYTDYAIMENGQQVISRSQDGIHVSSYGGVIISQKVISKLSEILESLK